MAQATMIDPEVFEQVGSLIEHLKGLLERFANDRGVSVDYNRRERSLIRFKFTTPDGFAIKVPYDLNQTSREYINSMMKRLAERLDDAHKQRHDSPIILTGVN